VRKEFADVSNLTHDNELWGRESRLRMFQLATGSGTPIARSSGCPRAHRCYMRVRSRRSGAIRSFADERAAYDALPEDMKRRLDSLVAEHSIFSSRARLGFTNFSDEERRELPAVPQAVVRTIPESGRKSLYLASHAGRIFGMPEPEGRALIDELIVHATQRQFVYTHRWRLYDLVMWDDRCTCTAAPNSTICAGSATCSAPRFAMSRTPASRKASRSQPRRMPASSCRQSARTTAKFKYSANLSYAARTFGGLP